MNFTIPTTKAELLATLKQIFYYYRIRREAYEGVILEDIVLERLSFTPLTDLELRERAEKLTAVSHYKQKQEYVDSIKAQISANETTASKLDVEKQKELEATETSYAKSISLIEEKVFANGFTNSTVMIDKIAELESEKNKRLTEIEALYSAKRTGLYAENSLLQFKLNKVDSNFEEIFEKEIEEKIIELKDEQEQLEREIFKYNNGLDEKEKRNKNSNINTNATLKIKYMEINGQFFSKDQLVELGYYDDVLNCVCGYYDSLDPLTAYSEFKSEKTLKIYLDDYYQNTLYMYKMRALDAEEGS